MKESEVDLGWLISVDDHVLEPPGVWQDRVPNRYRDIAPRIHRDDTGEFWVYESRRVPTPGLSAVAGKRFEEFSLAPVTYDEMRPGCYDPIARIADMDTAGILASMCFPSFPRFCGQVFYEAEDHDLALLCVQAYNDWMIDEWCASAPGRYIPLCLIPLWDPAQAAVEVRRCAEKGNRAIAFSEDPTPLGLPGINDSRRYWDPVWEACQETQTIVCMHLGSSSLSVKYSEDAFSVMSIAWFGGARASGTMLNWLFSPMFTEFPNLRIALSEGGIGWIPYFLERSEQVIEKQRYWAAKGDLTADFATGQTKLDSSRALDLDFDIRERFRDHVFGCFIDDLHGVRNIDRIGIDNVMIETDYPHSDSTWPNCISYAQKQVATLSNEDAYKVLRGNAERLFRFAPAVPKAVPQDGSDEKIED